MNCYKEFATIYDELINKDIDYKDWSNKILKLASDLNIKKEDYLDLACGTGNIIENIYNEFKHCFAVDLSLDMLTEAEDKLRKTSRGKIKFVCQNMCELQLNKKFDLITCCLDSINYILDKEDVEEMFSRVKSHLKDDGIMIFDINSYYKLTSIMGNNIFNYDSEDVVYIWDNSLEDDILNMYLTFFIKEKELYRRFDEEHSERAYKCSEIEEILHKNQLEVIRKLDNYEYKNVTDKTERIVYVIKKKKE